MKLSGYLKGEVLLVVCYLISGAYAACNADK